MKDNIFTVHITPFLHSFLYIMKNSAFALLSALSFSMAAQAQVAPAILSEHHAMLRVENQKKYLLLPVEEKQENAHIRIVRDNQLVGTINCRLAIDKVDYYVPYETRDGELFDIAFAANSRATGSIKGFTCWNKMKYADVFTEKVSDKFRPAYHHTPGHGWMNDPNGMFYKDGRWHLCYQWNPYASYWENMTWGHSSSADLIHWTPEPTALVPDALGTIFSGSAVVDKTGSAGFGKDAIVLMYTSARERQTQSMAYSTDGGKTFTKYAGNPILTADIPDFRDPKMFWNADAHCWNLILASGQEMWIYSSANLREWKFESAFGHGYGNHGGVWECPDLMKMKVEGSDEEKWMLICNINPGGPFGGSATQYFIGSFDGHEFKCESAPGVTKWMDYGKDHYATVTFDNAPSGRHVAMAWMSNWQYANQVPTLQFRSANTIARDLGLYSYNGATYCSVKPAVEMDAARGAEIASPAARCEIVVTLKGDARITLKNRLGERVTMTYDEAEGTFDMDRRRSGNVGFSDAFPCVTSAPTHGRLRQLRLFIDHSSIEAFDADGRMAMTNLVFPSEPYSRIEIKGKAKAKIYAID